MNQIKKGAAAAKRGKDPADSTAGAPAAGTSAATGASKSVARGSAAQERLILRIHGRVQGVGYRATAVEKANEIGVSGWVRNLENGVVELQAEGTPEQLDRLLLWCRKGPRLARVHEVDIWRQPATGDLQGFRVR